MPRMDVLKEGIRFAIQALLEHKLRTFLSVLGVTIGIFSIISVFSLVDSIRNNIDESISSLGNNVIYIQKWPWEFNSDFPWWSYMNRPVPNIRELSKIREYSLLSDISAFVIQTEGVIGYNVNSIDNGQISAVSDGYERVKSFELAEGRYFSDAELKGGKNIAVIGANVAEALFGSQSAQGRIIQVKNHPIQVIGVFKKEGQNIIDMGLDNSTIIPLNYAKSFTDINSESVNPHILVKAIPGTSNELLKDELSGIMRRIRRLSPRERDNFSLNETKLISKGFDELKNVIYLTGSIIGFFSILVGGFGIANIMFVSVKERTSLIGIQKALGARRNFILIEYISESILLSLAGGLIGLLLVYLMSAVLNNFIDFTIVMSLKNIISGILISSVIGLIAGIAPAYSAANLDPVEAIRSK